MKQSIKERLIKISQVQAVMVNQDVRRLSGAKQYLYQPRDWIFINLIANQINNAIFNLAPNQKVGGRSLNLQTIVLNPSIITGYTSGLKSFLQFALVLWRYVSVDNTINGHPTQYSQEQIPQIIANLTAQLGFLQFPEPKSINYKTAIINILNNWKNSV